MGRKACSGEAQQHQWQCEFSVGTCPMEMVPLKIKNSGLVELVLVTELQGWIAIDFTVLYFN